MGSTAVSVCMLLIATEVWLVEMGWLKSVTIEAPFSLRLHQEGGLSESTLETNVSCCKRCTKFIPKQAHGHD